MNFNQFLNESDISNLIPNPQQRKYYHIVKVILTKFKRELSISVQEVEHLLRFKEKDIMDAFNWAQQINDDLRYQRRLHNLLLNKITPEEFDKSVKSYYE